MSASWSASLQGEKAIKAGAVVIAGKALDIKERRAFDGADVLFYRELADQQTYVVTGACGVRCS